MTTQLAIVLALLAVMIGLFAFGRPRMDAVALLPLILLPAMGILTVGETFAGFGDPNVILIAALFVIGEGLSRTGVTYRLGDWLSEKAGSSVRRLVVLLMLVVACLGAFMSSTGVVAIFIPVVLSLTRRWGVSPRRLMLPLAFAALISGMLTLVSTPPNLIVDGELQRAGEHGFGFFTVTPFGIVILALAIGYMLLIGRRLAEADELRTATLPVTFSTLAEDYGVDRRTTRARVGWGSELIGTRLRDLNLSHGLARAFAVERRRALRGTVLSTDGDEIVRRGDTLVLDMEPGRVPLDQWKLDELSFESDFFDEYSRQVGMVEVLVTPDSELIEHSVRGLKFRSDHGVNVLGVKRNGQPLGPRFASDPLRAGDLLLLTGGWAAIQRLRNRAKGVVALKLPREAQEVSPAANRAAAAIGAIAVMALLMITGLVPNVVAALIAVAIMGASGVLDAPAAYRSIHWPTLMVIVGMLPFATALEQTGGIALMTESLSPVLRAIGPHGSIAAVFIVTGVIGLFVSNTATAVLMAPIAIALARDLGVSPLPFAMTVVLAASSAFMTPVSTPVNTLVMGPGRYRFGDFVRVGVPFTLVVLVAAVALVPVFLPF